MLHRIAPFAIALTLATSVFAHDKATGLVKERVDGMGVLSASMKTIVAQTQSQSPDAEIIKQAALDIQANAGTVMTDRFPKGSMDHPTEATETIWQKWARFEYLAQQLDLHAKGLVLAAGNPISGKSAELQDNRMLMDFATMGPDEVFTLLGKNCKACHVDFRAKKK